MMLSANQNLPADPNNLVGLKKLNPREHLFVLEYIKTDDLVKSAKRAGYADPTYGHKLLKQPHIEAEIIRVRSNMQAVQVVSRDFVLSELVGLFNDARTDDVKQDRRTMLACLEMISKISGFNAPDTQVNVQNNISGIRVEIIKPETNYIDDDSTDN